MVGAKHLLSKTFKSVFILDVSKMSRLLSIIDERFKGLGEQVIKIYKIKTKKGKEFSASKIDGILEHDNAVKNPITKYTINYADKDKDPDNSCFINFDQSDSEVNIEIISANSKWANDLFAEVEEQIERTFAQNFIYKIKKQRFPEMVMGLTVALMIPIIIFTISFSAGVKSSQKTDFLTLSEIAHLQEVAINIQNQNDKIDFLFDLHLKQLSNINKKPKNIIKEFKQTLNLFDLKMTFLALPIIVIFICFVYLLSRCYPGSIFLWGDYIEFYNSIIEKRKFVWNAIIFALIIGVLGNLFVFGVSRYV